MKKTTPAHNTQEITITLRITAEKDATINDLKAAAHEALADMPDATDLVIAGKSEAVVRNSVKVSV